MKKKIILCIFLLLMVSCGGEKEETVEIYNIVGIWEVSPTINCKEYDCQERDCSEAGISSKYSMTIEGSGDELTVLFHCDGEVNGPYELENKVDNTYIIYDFHDGGSYINIYELAITLNSDNLFTGEEIWRLINSNGCCKKVDNLIGERVR